MVALEDASDPFSARPQRVSSKTKGFPPSESPAETPLGLVPPPARPERRNVVVSWSVGEVSRVVSLCCAEAQVDNVAAIFRAHDIGGDVLADLSARDVVALADGVEEIDARIDARQVLVLRKFGSRTRLVRHLQKFVRRHGAKAWQDVERAVPALDDFPADVVSAPYVSRRLAVPRKDVRGACAWGAAESARVVRHVLVHLRRTDPAIASAVARAFFDHDIDGESLRNLDALALNDLVANLPADAAALLGQLGTRLWLSRELNAFVANFGDVNFAAVARELPIDASPLSPAVAEVPAPEALSQLVAPPAALDGRALDLLVKLAGKCRDNALLHPSLRTEEELQPPDKPGALRQVVVPVFMTILVKKLAADIDSEDKLSLVGTVIQRPLLYDLKKLQRIDGSESLPHFEMRVNEGEHAAGEAFTVRKVAPKDQKFNDATFGMTATTFASALPLKLYSVMSSHPFHVTAAEVLVELTSFTARGANGTTFELRPNLLCHTKDVRNLVAVRDWGSQDSLDEMKKWEILNTSPTVEYVIDGDDTTGKKPFYTPKVKITFYLYRDATQPFLETVMPVVFIIFTNNLNLIYTTDFNDFLANTLAIGLTIVFMIPQLSQNESFDEKMQLNQLYVLWIFLSLIVSSVAYTICGYQELDGHPKTKNHLKVAAVIFMWTCLLIPFRNLVLYRAAHQNLTAAPKKDGKGKDVANPMTFRGKPGSDKKKGDKALNTQGSSIEFQDLAQSPLRVSTPHTARLLRVSTPHT